MVPQEALLNILNHIKANPSPSCHLIKNMPGGTDDAMTLGALIAGGVEADYPGYTPWSMNSWPAPSIVAPDDGNYTHPQMTFQPVGLVTPQTIYGYWIEFKDAASIRNLWIFKRFTTPYVMSSDSSQLKITISVYDKDFSPP